MSAMRLVRYFVNGLITKVHRQELRSKVQQALYNLTQKRYYRCALLRSDERFRLFRNSNLGIRTPETFLSRSFESKADGKGTTNTKQNKEDNVAESVSNMEGAIDESDEMKPNPSKNSSKTWKAIPIVKSEAESEVALLSKPSVEEVLNNQTLQSYQQIRNHLELIQSQVMEILGTCHQITNAASLAKMEKMRALEETEREKGDVDKYEVVEEEDVPSYQRGLNEQITLPKLEKFPGYSLPFMNMVNSSNNEQSHVNQYEIGDKDGDNVFKCDDVNDPRNRKPKIPLQKGNYVSDDEDMVKAPPVWKKDDKLSPRLPKAAKNVPVSYHKSSSSTNEIESFKKKPSSMKTHTRKPRVVEYIPSEEAIRAAANNKSVEIKEAMERYQKHRQNSPVKENDRKDAQEVKRVEVPSLEILKKYSSPSSSSQSPSAASENENEEPNPWKRVYYDPFKHLKGKN